MRTQNQDVLEDSGVCLSPHLAAVVLHEDLRHVDDRAQGLNALPFPTTHWLSQNLQLQLLPLPHLLTLRLKQKVPKHTQNLSYTTHRMHYVSLYYYN